MLPPPILWLHFLLYHCTPTSVPLLSLSVCECWLSVTFLITSVIFFGYLMNNRVSVLYIAWWLFFALLLLITWDHTYAHPNKIRALQPCFARAIHWRNIFSFTPNSPHCGLPWMVLRKYSHRLLNLFPILPHVTYDGVTWTNSGNIDLFLCLLLSAVEASMVEEEILSVRGMMILLVRVSSEEF